MESVEEKSAMPKWTPNELEAVLAEIARRSSVDPDFRALAIKDAASAITKVSGKGAPEGQTFRFADNSGPEKVIALPEPVPDLEELSEAELAAIAGGAGNGNQQYTINLDGPTRSPNPYGPGIGIMK
jgi:hypothetical protein